jgi:ribosomal protein S11
MAFYLKTTNNVFITITNSRGQVVISQSAGCCKITTKKKKRSWDTLKAISCSVAKLARLKNIKYIFKIYTTSTYKKTSKIVFESFKEFGLRILKCVIVRSRPHGMLMRKKKLKRI